ncbi:hypothetical protein EMCRGX_G025027 [Ephydatia muelleri]
MVDLEDLFEEMNDQLEFAVYAIQTDRAVNPDVVYELLTLMCSSYLGARCNQISTAGGYADDDARQKKEILARLRAFNTFRMQLRKESSNESVQLRKGSSNESVQLRKGSSNESVQLRKGSSNESVQLWKGSSNESVQLRKGSSNESVQLRKGSSNESVQLRKGSSNESVQLRKGSS